MNCIMSLQTEYNRWWKGLRPEERKALIESGAFRADEPMNNAVGREKVNDGHFDFHLNEIKSFNRDSGKANSFITNDTTPADEVMIRDDEQHGIDPRLEELDLASIRLRATLHFLLEGLDESTDASMRLHADVIRIVVGEGKPPKMTVLAKKHNITRSAVSLRCRKLLRRLGLTPSVFMRPEDEVNAMRVSSILRHANKGGDGLTPGKESFNAQSRRATQSRPCEKDAQIRSFPKGKGKAKQKPNKHRGK